MDILSKKLLLDMPNAAVKCNSVYGEISAFKSVPAALSLCMTFRGTAEQYALIGNNRTVLGMPNGASNFVLYKRPDSGWLGGLCWSYTNAAATTESVATKLCFYNTVMSIITDGKPHCLVCCVNPTEKKIKAYVDGVYVNDGNNSYKTFTATPTAFIASNSFRMGITTAYTLAGGCTISNIKYFNFDISAAGAGYTLDDYQNNRDIPEILLLGELKPQWATITSENGVSSSSYVDGIFSMEGTSSSASISTRCSTPFVASAGSVIRIKNGDATFTGSGVTLKLFFRDAANADGAKAISLNLAGEQTVVLTRDITKLAFTCDSATGDVGGTKGALVAISVSKDGVILNLHNKLSGSTWTDDSGNGYNMTLSGDFEITDE